VAADDSLSGNSAQPPTPDEPTALSSDGDRSSSGQDLTGNTGEVVTEPRLSTTPASRPRNKTWRGDWQIAVVVAAVIAVLAGVLWLHNNSHKTRRPIVLPSTLLRLNRDTSPAALQSAQNLVANEQANVAALGKPVAGLYRDTGTGGFSVLVGTPCEGGSCVSESSQQVVQDERAHGHADTSAFPPGPAGGILICFSDTGHGGNVIHCAWIDQVTEGLVVFSGGFAPTLADAAAKTRQVRDAIEH